MREGGWCSGPTPTALLVLAVAGCSYLPSPSLPTSAELDYRQLQRQLGEDRNERRAATERCIASTAGRDTSFQNDIADAMGSTSGDVPTEFCRRLIVGITRDRLTYEDVAALQGGAATEMTWRKLADVVADPGYAEEYGPID